MPPAAAPAGAGGSPCGAGYRSWLCSFLRCGSSRAQNLVDVPLDGLQLLEPLFLFVIGVIQAVFLGDKLLDLGLQRFPGGQLGNAMRLEIPGCCVGYDKSLSCACRMRRGLSRISALSARRGRAWSWRRQVPAAATPFSLAASFPVLSACRCLAHFLIGGINGGFQLLRGSEAVS